MCIVGQTTVVYEVRPQYETVVVKEKKKDKGDDGSAAAGKYHYYHTVVFLFCFPLFKLFAFCVV